MSDQDAPPLSLKARQNASRTLKRIFDRINSLPPNFPDMLPQTRDFLSLHPSSDSFGNEMPMPESSIRVDAPRPSAFRPLKMQTDGNMFQLEQHGKSCSQKTRCTSPDPSQKVQIRQQDPESATIAKDQKEGAAMVASQNLAAYVQDGNQRAFRSASPAPSSISQQNGCFTQVSSRPSSSSGAAARKQPKAQLTIFYGGMVNVYDDVPADKAHAIMLLAGSGNSWSAPLMNGLISSLPVPSSGATTAINAAPSKELGVSLATPIASPSSSVFSAEMKQHQLVKRSHAELPFARKQSLARFLEKRRDRAQAIKSTSTEVPKNALENTVEDGSDQAAKRLCSRPSSPSALKNSLGSHYYVGDQSRPSTPPMTPKRIS